MSSSVSRSISVITLRTRNFLVKPNRQYHISFKVHVHPISGVSKEYSSFQLLHHSCAPRVNVSQLHNNATKPVSVKNERVEEIRKLVKELNSEDRLKVLGDLQRQEADEVKKKAEEKLASLRWRSRFGRPSSLHQSADPTGTFCQIPEEWLQQKAAEQTKSKPPSWSELQRFSIFNALPFVGFGFLDNAIMILCGEYFDITIGTYLGISTMAAAALGNIISDLAGIGSAWYVEYSVAKVGFRSPSLSSAQLEMPSVRWSANIGRSIGVVIGCLLGMFPLFWISPKKEQKYPESQKVPTREIDQS